jgi:hypothetical protein
MHMTLCVNPPTLLELSDVPNKPRVKMDLPTLRVGERLRLAFTLKRQHGGRSEVLEVTGEFRIVTASTDASSGQARQLLAVEAIGKAPSWRAVRKSAEPARRPPPARFPRTVVA